MKKSSLILPAAMAGALLVPAMPTLVGLEKPAIIRPAKDWADHEKKLLANFLPGMMGSFDRATVAFTYATWNPADIHSDNSLSGGNLTVTRGVAAFAFRGVRATKSHSSSKYYYETDLTAITAPNDSLALGIGNSTMTLTTFPGSTYNSTGMLNGTGKVGINSVVVATYATFVQGQTLCMAVDLDNMRMWYRTNGGNWNNNASADPATNTLGVDISSLNASGAGPPYFPAMCLSNSGDTFTSNFGASAYAQAVPSGFSNW